MLKTSTEQWPLLPPRSTYAGHGAQWTSAKSGPEAQRGTQPLIADSINQHQCLSKVQWSVTYKAVYSVHTHMGKTAERKPVMSK